MSLNIIRSNFYNSNFLKNVALKRFSRSTSTIYDLAVIGSGPGGYVAAIKASQLGLKTACIEKNSTLGGTCLNIGCIPSKALLHSSYYYHLAKSGKLSNFGIECPNVSLDLPKMMNHKDQCVKALTSGIASLFKYNKVDHIKGHGKIVSLGKINVTKSDGSTETIEAKNTLIATGSESLAFPGIDVDENIIVSSTGALTLKSIPKRFVVIGAGVIGLELGSVWGRLGSQVTCIEFLPNIGGAGIDSDVSKSLLGILKKSGMNFLLGHKVLSAKKENNEVVVKYENMATHEINSISCDILMVSVGRKPFTSNMGLENVGVKLDQKGRIIVNNMFLTSAENIYAIGDCIPGAMLAHKAEEEGIACVEGISGRPVHINYNAIPSVIYTHPEVAWVGISEDDAKKASIKYKIGKFPLSSNGRSRAVGETDGFAKVITEADTDKLIGAHFISSCAGETINEMAMAMEYGASAEDVARVCHAHPTVSECLKEASLAAYFGKPINSI